jgi:hypothetical protein
MSRYREVQTFQVSSKSISHLSVYSLTKRNEAGTMMGTAHILVLRHTKASRISTSLRMARFPTPSRPLLPITRSLFRMTPTAHPSTRSHLLLQITRIRTISNMKYPLLRPSPARHMATPMNCGMSRSMMLVTLGIFLFCDATVPKAL